METEMGKVSGLEDLDNQDENSVQIRAVGVADQRSARRGPTHPSPVVVLLSQPGTKAFALRFLGGR